ncbi:MAG: 4Fe-4S ferredoxin [Rhodobiaceae bacterium]|nr:4Fe-4S ferredoxin [Rhodobiaceae bacterium]
MRLDDHPTVQKVRATRALKTEEEPLNATWLKELCKKAGADDVGLVSIDRPEIADQKMDILSILPETKTLISIVSRMNRDAVRTATRSIANHEFHETYTSVNETARHIVKELEARGIPAVNAVAAFPMEVQDFPGKSWPVSHKPIAEAAGMGKIGFHRNVIHPKFGNFILLDTILIGAPVTDDSKPLNYNPCVECKLCVAACPVEAIGPDGSFNFSACYSHNYREFLGGFLDWTEQVADAKDKHDYRERVEDGEVVSMWQSLSFKPSYKAAYCISVCPAGEDVISPYLDDRVGFAERHVKPLQETAETIYVLPNSDAEKLVPSRFPAKTVKQVRWNVGAKDIFSYLFNITLTFQRRKAGNLNATYHLRLTGDMPLEATITIASRRIEIEFGLTGEPDLTIETSADVWMGALESSFDLESAIKEGRMKLDGPEETFRRLAACFPTYGDIN